MKKNIRMLDNIKERAKQKNVKDEMLIMKYENDIKFMRIHKRMKEANFENITDLVLNQLLLDIKHQVDDILVKNYKLLDNEAFFYRSITPIIVRESLKNSLGLTIPQIQLISNNVLEEYEEERKMAS